MFARKNLLIVITLVIILAGACSSPEGPSAISAALSELTGRVDMKQAGSDSFAPATAESVLDVNGQIQTGDDGRVRLDLSSGTIIRVAPSSLFTLASNDEVEGGLATRIKLELGKVFIILNGGSTDVETPSGVASVRGSYMKVEVDPLTGDVYVTCLEGDCRATNPAGTVSFTQGEKVVLFHQDPDTGNWTAPGVEPMSPQDFQEWLDDNPEAAELFNQAMATATAMAAPTAPPTLEPVVQTGDASDACFDILGPPSGSELPHLGPINFQWEPQTGAVKYMVTFRDANGNVITFDTTETSIRKYIEIMPDAGAYEWVVTAYGGDGAEICTAKSASFSKPESNWEPEKPKEEPTEPPYCDPCDYFGGCYDPQSC